MQYGWQRAGTRLRLGESGAGFYGGGGGGGGLHVINYIRRAEQLRLHRHSFGLAYS